MGSIMSLLHLVHKSVAIKFSDVAKNQYNPEARYAFRLTGVDAMGFLQIQDLRQNSQAGHDAASEPYWINKDLVREIHEIDLAKAKEPLTFTGLAPQPPAEVKTEQAHREVTPKPAKAKIPAKKPALK
jgi:hypothetical protein